MAAKGTKSAKATASTKKTKPSKKTTKLPGFFSLKNQKFILLVAVVVGFAAGGTYWFYGESSARVAKDLTTVQGCQAAGVVLRSGPNNTVGSTGSCVKVVQTILSFYFYQKDAISGTSYLVNDGLYGARTALAVGAFQKDYHLEADGIVGPKTWAWLRNGACIDVRMELHACGDF